MKNKQSNFYLRWQQQQKEKRQDTRHSRLVAALPALLVVGGLLGGYGVVTGLRLYTEARAADALVWCQDADRQEQYTLAITNQTLTRLYQGQTLAAQDGWAAIASYPAVTSTLLGTVRAAGSEGITLVFDTYDSATGHLSFTARSAQVIDIPGYVRALEGTGVFARVSYTGYGFNNQAGTYTIDLDCTLAAPEKEG